MYGPFIHFLRLRLIAGEVPKQEEAGRAAPTGPWTVCEATAPAGGGGGEITSATPGYLLVIYLDI
jgi:hypothetical protein